MKKIIYIKKAEELNDVLEEKYYKIPQLFKRIIYVYKQIFNIITKKNIENEEIWILPLLEKKERNKTNNIFKKISNYKENIYVLSSDLETKEIYKLLKYYNINYLDGNSIKKYLVIKILEYITNIQNEEISNLEITVLVNELTEYNNYLIEKLSKMVKGIKIVSNNLYKFKRLEEKLYYEYGIAIQFSNSFRKSLLKSKYIINLDYNQIDINEYEIFNKAIIINAFEEKIKIKSKLFNGILINSCNIKFKKELRDKFRKMNIYHMYNHLHLYQSNIIEEKNLINILHKLEDDKVTISNLIGNNGYINKKEFKNIFKTLDK